ncbi:LacI family DNA-binding transcriptional regulator [Zafaria sp. Z1313]|uniref:LacI family DNA-binding transcriptional regulator n=1 Tax=unclassified Zafaria TaxID=2828765 RepID=UPI002E78F63F|nr:LacI family DNA-binding transcriptional regulator [Zafaria sp. J156]MEE1622242.1 LacI family DNA-binding transcriptional regulator [Zafaria sp. J156]
MPLRPTMHDIAEHLGVSRQLVSLVLRDAEGPSEESRRRVRAAAQELGYHPDQSARLLRGRRSHRLGVLFSMKEPFEADLVERLLTAAAARGYSLALGPHGPSRPQAGALAELLGQRIEALLVLSGDSGLDTIDGLPDTVPLVQLGGPAAGDGHDDVRADDAAGFALLVDHLVDLGHRRIAHVSGGSGPNAAARRTAYAQQMRSRGLSPDTVEAAYTEEAGYRAAVQLLDREASPTAIMAANDRCAVGVMAALASRGVAVPGRVSVTGFDDSSVASWPFMDLTTVDVDPSALAEAALEAAVYRAGGGTGAPAAERVVPRLVVRSSTGPA